MQRRFSTPHEIGTAVASEIARGIVDSGRRGRQYLLGCPGGRTHRWIQPGFSAIMRHNIDRLLADAR